MKESGVKTGDLCVINGAESLCLGEHVSFEEKMTHTIRLQGPVTIRIERILSRKTMKFLHHFVNHRFTTYKNTLPLFLGSSCDHLIKYQKRTKLKKQDQHVHIYPTLWALMQATTSNERATGLVLHSGLTSVQKAKAYWSIKQGVSSVVYCTYSQIFQDRASLREIHLYDQHARWYKHQQDPRYYVPTVIQHLAEQTGGEVMTYGQSLETKFA